MVFVFSLVVFEDHVSISYEYIYLNHQRTLERDYKMLQVALFGGYSTLERILVESWFGFSVLRGRKDKYKIALFLSEKKKQLTCHRN